MSSPGAHAALKRLDRVPITGTSELLHEPLADLFAHLRVLQVSAVVAQQLPVFGMAGGGVDLLQFRVDLFEAGERRELVLVPRERQMSARRDQRIHLRGGEVVCLLYTSPS